MEAERCADQTRGGGGAGSVAAQQSKHHCVAGRVQGDRRVEAVGDAGAELVVRRLRQGAQRLVVDREGDAATVGVVLDADAVAGDRLPTVHHAAARVVDVGGRGAAVGDAELARQRAGVRQVVVERRVGAGHAHHQRRGHLLELHLPAVDAGQQRGAAGQRSAPAIGGAGEAGRLPFEHDAGIGRIPAQRGGGRGGGGGDSQRGRAAVRRQTDAHLVLRVEQLLEQRLDAVAELAAAGGHLLAHQLGEAGGHARLDAQLQVAGHTQQVYHGAQRLGVERVLADAEPQAVLHQAVGGPLLERRAVQQQREEVRQLEQLGDLRSGECGLLRGGGQRAEAVCLRGEQRRGEHLRRAVRRAGGQRGEHAHAGRAGDVGRLQHGGEQGRIAVQQGAEQREERLLGGAVGGQGGGGGGQLCDALLVHLETHGRLLAAQGGDQRREERQQRQQLIVERGRIGGGAQLSDRQAGEERVAQQGEADVGLGRLHGADAADERGVAGGGVALAQAVFEHKVGERLAVGAQLQQHRGGLVGRLAVEVARQQGHRRVGRVDAELGGEVRARLRVVEHALQPAHRGEHGQEAELVRLAAGAGHVAAAVAEHADGVQRHHLLGARARRTLKVQSQHGDWHVQIDRKAERALVLRAHAVGVLRAGEAAAADQVLGVAAGVHLHPLGVLRDHVVGVAVLVERDRHLAQQRVGGQPDQQRVRVGRTLRRPADRVHRLRVRDATGSLGIAGVQHLSQRRGAQQRARRGSRPAQRAKVLVLAAVQHGVGETLRIAQLLREHHVHDVGRALIHAVGAARLLPQMLQNRAVCAQLAHHVLREFAIAGRVG
mmetsp:Transcript_10196/g.31364  ORF Transcript_10196/g.31364 Transcript_10196/m.31364 type:complete len:828 (-) Transcript_10196:1895-4378(-)